MTPNRDPSPASDLRRAFTFDTMADELRADLLALADQWEAEIQVDAGQGRRNTLAFPVPNAGAHRRDP